jgi:hypothetical protein
MHVIQPETVRRVISLAEAVESEKGASAGATGGAFPGADGGPSGSAAELEAFLSSVPHQEIVELVAMISVGRGDPGSDRFEFILGNIYMTKEKAVRYLVEKDHLAEYLKKAMTKLDMNE